MMWSYCAPVGGVRAGFRVAVLAVTAGLLPGAPGAVAQAAGQDEARVDAAFEAFLAARDPSEAARRASAIVETGVSVEEAYDRLARGRRYEADVPRGTWEGRRSAGGLAHTYTVSVPEDYDPARRYPVRVQLHGGISRPAPRPVRSPNRISGTVAEIVVRPHGWDEATWWSDAQVENVHGILDTLKRTYNIDENLAYVTGISDGGTGVCFLAMRDTTPWASFLPLNGFVMVLANPATGIDGNLYLGNAVNKPFFVVNGGRDRLYPTRIVEPYIDHLARIGVSVEYRPRPEAGHDTSWWTEERPAFEAFVAAHPRDPHPRRVSWETDRTDRSERAHWLRIDALGRADGEHEFASNNEIDWSPVPRVQTLFRHRGASGRVDVVRAGHVVEATTHGVRAFTLLFSPAVFDLAAPVRVIVNGRPVFEGRVEPRLETLLAWAARDNDRTMLFTAELAVSVP